MREISVNRRFFTRKCVKDPVVFSIFFMAFEAKFALSGAKPAACFLSSSQSYASTSVSLHKSGCTGELD